MSPWHSVCLAFSLTWHSVSLGIRSLGIRSLGVRSPRRSVSTAFSLHGVRSLGVWSRSRRGGPRAVFFPQGKCLVALKPLALFTSGVTFCQVWVTPCATPISCGFDWANRQSRLFDSLYSLWKVSPLLFLFIFLF